MMMKYVYNILGGFFLFVGVVGIFLPLLPTTPFLILSGFFFSKGSEKFHHWLMNHKYFGPPVQDWKKNGVIRLKHKLIATGMLAISSLFIFSSSTIPKFGKIGFSTVVCLVLLFIWSRPSSAS